MEKNCIQSAVQYDVLCEAVRSYKRHTAQFENYARKGVNVRMFVCVYACYVFTVCV